MILLTLALCAFAEPPTVPLEAPKFGVKVQVPKAWPILQRERNEYVFVAKVPGDDPERQGAVACELGLAPESLEEYRKRIDGNAARGDRPGTLVRNEVVKGPRGERLETLWEFRPAGGALWRELTIRVLANRQMYAFVLNVDEAAWAPSLAAFEAMVATTVFTPPNTGADLVDRAKNRWLQREFQFALDLPRDWRPALAPDEVALFYAHGPAHGIWADNALVIASKRQPLDLNALQQAFPDQLKEADPSCEIVACKVVPQGAGEALETIVRTKRGPFSMTILERRFRGLRFNFEVKYTVETQRFDALFPELKRSLDGFGETPGDPAPERPESPAARRSAQNLGPGREQTRSVALTGLVGDD